MRAFLKKEWMELCRSGRLLVLLLVFTLFGIMNPAFAKLTPWLMETLSESLADAGLVAASVKIDAMTSWVQFYKNIPAGLVIFILINSGNFTNEYQKGTLIPVVTKGLSRQSGLFAKALLVFCAWTVLYLLCFGITYAYNAYFWDNSIANELLLAVALTWLFGVWLIALFVFFSAAAQSSSQVLLGVGGVVAGGYLFYIFPSIGKYLPVKLMDGMSLLQGTAYPKDYYGSIAVAVVMICLCMAAGTALFNRKQL